MELKIDELAERAGVTRRTIRYYIASGLLAAPGARGMYGQAHLDRVLTIKRLQAERLSLREIRDRLIGDAVMGSISRVSEADGDAARSGCRRHRQYCTTQPSASFSQTTRLRSTRP